MNASGNITSRAFGLPMDKYQGASSNAIVVSSSHFLCFKFAVLTYSRLLLHGPYCILCNILSQFGLPIRLTARFRPLTRAFSSSSAARVESISSRIGHHYTPAHTLNWRVKRPWPVSNRKMSDSEDDRPLQGM